MTAHETSFIVDRESEVKASKSDIFFTDTDLDFQQTFLNKNIKIAEMVALHYFKFSYLGTTRNVICDLDTSYEKIQDLVAKTFRLPEECVTAIQFTDGKSYHFTKELFENFILLFPQPEQKFHVRLDVSKIIENRIASKEGKRTPFGLIKDTNKRTHDDMLDADGEQTYAAPVRRSNCFWGVLPDNDGTIIEEEISETKQQPRKRARLMKSVKKAKPTVLKTPQAKLALRL